MNLNENTKKRIVVISAIIIICWVAFLCYQLFLSFKLNTPVVKKGKPKTGKTIKVFNGTASNIFIKNSNFEFSHNNYALKQSLNLSALKAVVLNKSFTLQIPNLFGSEITSDYITEFN